MKELSKLTELDIYGHNELNRISYDILSDLILVLESYKGKKIYTAEGKTTAKTPIEAHTPQDGKIGYSSINGNLYRSCTAYVNKSGSSLWLNVSLCFNGGDYNATPRSTAFTQYFKKELFLGTAKNQILEEVKTLDSIVKSYNLAEVLNIDKENEKIEEFNDLLNKAEHKQNEIPYFLRK